MRNPLFLALLLSIRAIPAEGGGSEAAILNNGLAVRKVVVGRSFSFVLDHIGRLSAMGSNKYGQLGLVTNDTEVLDPTEVLLPTGERVKDVAAGAFFSLILAESGRAYAAGRNDFGQIGVGSDGPGLVEVMSGVAAVAAGYAHSLFLLEDGSVRAAGLNTVGQLGDGSTVSTLGTEPATVFVGNVSSIAAGYDFSYFLLNTGEAFAVGQNLGGQLGDGTREPRLRPVKVLDDVQAISCGESHGLFLTESAALLAAGANFDFQLGQQEGHFFPSPVTAMQFGVRSVSAGGDSSCAVDENGTAMGMGSNREGQLGLGAELVAETPKTINASRLAGPLVVEVAAIGESHSIFVTTDAAILATGTNAHGELGDGAREQRYELTESFQITRTQTTSVTGTITTTEPDVYTTTRTSTSRTRTTRTYTTTAPTTSTFRQAQTSNGEEGIYIALGVIVFCFAAVCLCRLGGEGHSEVDNVQNVRRSVVQLP